MTTVNINQKWIDNGNSLNNGFYKVTEDIVFSYIKCDPGEITCDIDFDKQPFYSVPVPEKFLKLKPKQCIFVVRTDEQFIDNSEEIIYLWYLWKYSNDTLLNYVPQNLMKFICSFCFCTFQKVPIKGVFQTMKNFNWEHQHFIKILNEEYRQRAVQKNKQRNIRYRNKQHNIRYQSKIRNQLKRKIKY